MECPRCETPLSERGRDDVTIDACEESHGVWLDRGEVGKLIVRISSFGEIFGDD